MKTRLGFLLAACFMSASPLALAAPATPQEAERLQTLFKGFMGEGADALTVKANGDFYDVTLDFAAEIKNYGPTDDGCRLDDGAESLHALIVGDVALEQVAHLAFGADQRRREYLLSHFG